jgi:hypothetical protein
MNFSRQPAQQKCNVSPQWVWRCFEVAGSTFMPQTGSVAVFATAQLLDDDHANGHVGVRAG